MINIDNEVCAELIRMLEENKRYGFLTKIKKIIKIKSPKRDIAFWPNALIIYALIKEDAIDSVRVLMSDWKRRKYRIENYDDILMGYILLSKTDLLNSDDRLLLINSINKSIEKYYNKVVPYRSHEEHLVYIDLLGMLPQYLCWYGCNYNDNNYVQWAAMQFDEFIQNATDESTGLPYHVYDKKTGERLGLIGWGRSLGWIMIGLSESIISLTDRYSEQREKIVEIYKNYFKIIKSYQRRDGGFSWHLLKKGDHLDSSATSMILMSAYIAKDYLNFSMDDAESLEKMYKCLSDCYDNGKVLDCSAECGGVGIYPQKYDSYAWSVAPYAIIRAIRSEDVKK